MPNGLASRATVFTAARERDSDFRNRFLLWTHGVHTARFSFPIKSVVGLSSSCAQAAEDRSVVKGRKMKMNRRAMRSGTPMGNEIKERGTGEKGV